MKPPRKQIYMYLNPKESQVTYTGIDFAEFVRFLPQPIDNLMLLMGGSSALSIKTKTERGLELFEGREMVDELTRMNIYDLGNFCFTDYAISGNTKYLSEEQIAELLYLGHMFKPLRLPFFEPLQNRFVYLAHDDGWYCKLYCRDLNDFISVVCGKIANYIGLPLPNNLRVMKEQLFRYSTAGLLLDLGETLCEKNGIRVKMYTIGSNENMDNILNNINKIKDCAKSKNELYANKKVWTIV